jgi:NADH-quinone oxidoreductase subunit E
MDGIDFSFIDEILQKNQYDKAKTITIMQEVQEKYNYLPQKALAYVAEKLGISEAKIYGVATFYGNFSLFAKGKYVIRVCRGTACHVRRSETVLQAVYESTGLSEDKPSSEDGLFSIEIVSCLGACGLSPVVMVNDVVHPSMTPAKAKALIAELREKEGVK